MHTRSTDLILLAGLWLTGRVWDPVVAELAHLGQHATVPSLPGADDHVTTASLDGQVAAVVVAVRPDEARDWLAVGEIPELQRASEISFVDIDSGHWPMITRPVELARLLDTIAREG